MPELTSSGVGLARPVGYIVGAALLVSIPIMLGNMDDNREHFADPWPLIVVLVPLALASAVMGPVAGRRVRSINVRAAQIAAVFMGLLSLAFAIMSVVAMSQGIGN